MLSLNTNTQFSAQYSPHFILAAAGFPEVSDWGELCVDGLAIEPAVVQVHNGFLCILLVTKLHPKDTHILRKLLVEAHHDSTPFKYTKILKLTLT